MRTAQTPKACRASESVPELAAVSVIPLRRLSRTVPSTDPYLHDPQLTKTAHVVRSRGAKGGLHADGHAPAS